MLHIIQVILGVLGGLFIWFLILLGYALCKTSALCDWRIRNVFQNKKKRKKANKCLGL